MVSDRLAVGYLHAGRPEHGVSRYGRVLAAAGRTHAGADVLEAVVDLSGGAAQRWSSLQRAARALTRADVVHMQYNNLIFESIWGRGWQQIGHIGALRTLLSAPLVVTVHDVYERPHWPGVGRFVRARVRHAVSRVRRRLTRNGVRDAGASDRSVDVDAAALRWLERTAQVLLVCSHEEQRRLEQFLPDAQVRVIPHFVEWRPVQLGSEAARQALGLTGRIVTVLGYIHEAKGHALLLDALPSLPADVTVVFAGTAEPGHAAFLEELRQRADSYGVAGHLHVTGFLSDSELDVYLAATDLAVCPFARVSASGSLSTWIAAARPVLAADLPLVAEYNQLEPGALHTFAPYTAEALAGRIRELLEGTADTAAVERLRERLHEHAIFEQHLAAYRQARDARSARR